MKKSTHEILDEVIGILDGLDQDTAVLVLAPREYLSLRKVMTTSTEYVTSSGGVQKDFLMYRTRKIFLIKRDK